MFSKVLILGATAGSMLMGYVNAQTNLTACCNIDPNGVDLNTRLSWCRAQKNTCPLLCMNGQTSNNTCDGATLTYTCTCMNGNAPNISDYSQTLPSLECDNWKQQCIAAHPNDLNGQQFCLSYVCGMKNASAVGAGVTTSSAAASATGSSTAGGAASTTTSKAAADVLVRDLPIAGLGLLLFGLL